MKAGDEHLIKLWEASDREGHVENILLKLLQNADFDKDRAQQGIIYIDEIDKIGRTTSNV